MEIQERGFEHCGGGFIKTSWDFYFPDGFDIDHSHVTNEVCFTLLRLFKALPLKVNAK